MTAYGTIESAVEAMRLGAFDYIQKPFTEQELLVKVEQGARQPAPARRGAAFSRASSRSATGSRTSSAARRPMREVLGRIVEHRADRRDRAHHRRERHRQGARRQGDPRQQPARRSAVRAGQLRRHHRDAARERAVRPRAGRVHRRGQRAQGPLRRGRRRHVLLRRDRRDAAAFQAKLLRAIQEGEIRRVGENKPDPRRRAHHRRDEPGALERRSPRSASAQDLYYRLNVARFVLPPLRERRRTSRCSLEFFLEQYNRKTQPPRAVAGVRRAMTPTTSPATSASSRTWSSRRWRCRTAAGMTPTTCSRRRSAKPTATPRDGGRTLADVVDAAERQAIEAALRDATTGSREGGRGARHLRDHALAQDDAAGPARVADPAAGLLPLQVGRRRKLVRTIPSRRGGGAASAALRACPEAAPAGRPRHRLPAGPRGAQRGQGAPGRWRWTSAESACRTAAPGWSRAAGASLGRAAGAESRFVQALRTELRRWRPARCRLGHFADSDKFIEDTPAGLDPRVVRRLRRGEFAVKAHVDLHGLLKDKSQALPRSLPRPLPPFWAAAASSSSTATASTPKTKVPVLEEALQALDARGPLLPPRSRLLPRPRPRRRRRRHLRPSWGALRREKVVEADQIGQRTKVAGGRRAPGAGGRRARDGQGPAEERRQAGTGSLFALGTCARGPRSAGSREPQRAGEHAEDGEPHLPGAKSPRNTVGFAIKPAVGGIPASDTHEERHRRRGAGIALGEPGRRASGRRRRRRAGSAR